MPRHLKGSQEMKDHMKHLRSLRKNKSSKDAVESKSEAPTESPKEEVVEEIVGTGKKRIHGFATYNNMQKPIT